MHVGICHPTDKRSPGIFSVVRCNPQIHYDTSLYSYSSNHQPELLHRSVDRQSREMTRKLDRVRLDAVRLGKF